MHATDAKSQSHIYTYTHKCVWMRRPLCFTSAASPWLTWNASTSFKGVKNWPSWGTRRFRRERLGSLRCSFTHFSILVMTSRQEWVSCMRRMKSMRKSCSCMCTHQWRNGTCKHGSQRASCTQPGHVLVGDHAMAVQTCWFLDAWAVGHLAGVHNSYQAQFNIYPQPVRASTHPGLDIGWGPVHSHSQARGHARGS